MKNIKNLKIAILIADGFEHDEMTKPKKSLEDAGAKTTIISPVKGKVKSWKAKNWGDEFPVELDLEQAKVEDFDALLLPGGVINPDTLRLNEKAVALIKGFIKAHKPIASICHGPWTLINAEGVKGRTLTSWPSIKIDLINAGANWIDRDVVIDDNLITSRKPDDIPAFTKALIEMLTRVHSLA